MNDHDKGDKNMRITQGIFAAMFVIGCIGNTLLVAYVTLVAIIGNPLLYLINPLFYFQVIFTLLTMPIFWILLAIAIVGFFAAQKEEDEYCYSEERGRKAREEAKWRKFTLIPAGEFRMGSEEHDWEKPVHKVKINKSFYLGTYPVTQREWKAVMGSNPSHFKGNDLPVEQVSWNDVQEFIMKLNEKEGTNKYRLPSEAEWEYACRAGTTTRYSFGDYVGDDEFGLGGYAWYSKNSGYPSKTHPVGKKKLNPYGLYDMHGNVWEWVQDVWHNDYDGAPADGSAWESDSAWESGDISRPCRGGSYSFGAECCRSADRNHQDTGDRFSVLGFRLIKEL
jgi:formylglycine-generating enzyme required for sulfatase activity